MNCKSFGRVLVVLHQKQSTAGRFGRILRAEGLELDVRRPRFGDPLPETLKNHAGVIVFGGPMSVNDEKAWLRREIDWIGVPLRERKPFLGICLGAQMLARHLGHRVRPHPEGRVEIGYYPIHPTEQGHRVCACRFPSQVYQWHGEGFDLPCGATLLARGQDFEAQPGARPRHRHLEGWFRHDRAVGRWSGAFLRRWLAGGHPSA